MSAARWSVARRGFSLVEALVVVSLVGALVSLLLPAVQKVRTAAARGGCSDSLRQVALALHAYHATHGRLPPGPVPPGRRRADPNACLGWMALLLPHVEQGRLYETSAAACAVEPDPTRSPPHVGHTTPVKLYTCPADARLSRPQRGPRNAPAAFTSFIGSDGVAIPPGPHKLGVLGGAPGDRLGQVTDGTSSTVMIGERPPPDTFQAGWWYPAAHGAGGGYQGPNNFLVVGLGSLFGDDTSCQRPGRGLGPGRTENPCDRFHFWSLHPGGANFAFCDGGVRYLPYTAHALIPALVSRSGAESVELP